MAAHPSDCRQWRVLARDRPRWSDVVRLVGPLASAALGAGCQEAWLEDLDPDTLDQPADSARSIVWGTASVLVAERRRTHLSGDDWTWTVIEPATAADPTAVQATSLAGIVATVSAILTDGHLDPPCHLDPHLHPPSHDDNAPAASRPGEVLIGLLSGADPAAGPARTG